MQRVSDRWVSITLSVLLHAVLLGALAYGWLLFRRPPRPAPTLAIEAHVVDARSVRGVVQPAPPAQAPPESVGPPQPTPDELSQREQQRQQEEAAAAEKQRAAEQQAAAEAAAAAAAAAAEVRAAAERKAREDAEAQKRAAEEKQRLAEAKQQAQEQAQREEDLKRDLAAEEDAKKARAGPALASWKSQIEAKITHNWVRPPTARPGIKCVLKVTQVPGGEVTNVSIAECNGDEAVRDSIQAAVYRASPLPAPPDPALFDRVLVIEFTPED
jgi:colicin import membrane protein